MSNANPIFVLGSFVAACSVKVGRFPRPGESVLADGFTLEAGGKGFNCAAALRKLDVAVDGLFATGDDFFADFAAAAFARMDVPAHALRRFAGATGAGVGLVDPSGENVIAVYPGANGLLSPDDVAKVRDRIRQSRFVVAQFEIADAPIAAAFAAAKEFGVATVLNPSPYRVIAGDIWSATDTLVVNETEAGQLAGDWNASLDETARDRHGRWAPVARALLAGGLSTLVVTFGQHGASAWSGAHAIHQPAFAVECVDTIGAGDAFLAGFLAEIWTGNGMPMALRSAAACGALATTRCGLLDALPDRPMLAAFLQRP
jgi:ribokinase